MPRFFLALFLLVLTAFSNPTVQAQGYTLEQCINLALQNNVNVQLAELNKDLVGIGLNQNKAAFLPSANASGGYGVNIGQTIDPFTNQFATNSVQSASVGLGTGITLYNGLQNQNRLKQSRIDFDRAQADLEATANNTSLAVANAYLAVLLNQELRNVAETNLDGTRQQAVRIAKLVEAGASPEGSLLEIQALQARDEASFNQASNNFGLSLISLAQLINLDPNEWNSFSIATPNIPDPSSLSLPSDANALTVSALSNLPQMQSAKLSQTSAEYGIKVARGAFQPRLSASYNVGTGFSGARQEGVGEQVTELIPIGLVEGTNEIVLTPRSSFNSFETPSVFDQFEDNINQSVFLNLSIPIFNGFAVKSNVERAQVGLQQSKLNATQTELQVRQDVARAYADAQFGLRNYDSARLALDANQRAFDYAKVRYEAGVSNATQYNDARVQLDVAKANLLQQKYDYFFRLKVLDFYSGKPLTLTP